MPASRKLNPSKDVVDAWRDRYRARDTLREIGASFDPPVSAAVVFYWIGKDGATFEGRVPLRKAFPKVSEEAFDAAFARYAKKDVTLATLAAEVKCSVPNLSARFAARRKADARERANAEIARRRLVAVAVQTLGVIREPSLAARMAGRARIPRRIDRLEGVESPSPVEFKRNYLQAFPEWSL